MARLACSNTSPSLLQATARDLPPSAMKTILQQDHTQSANWIGPTRGHTDMKSQPACVAALYAQHAKVPTFF